MRSLVRTDDVYNPAVRRGLLMCFPRSRISHEQHAHSCVAELGCDLVVPILQG